MLGKCFRCSSSCDDPRISPLTPQYECPRQSLSIITSDSENQRNRTEVLFHYSMLYCSGCCACFEHSNFFKVNVPVSPGTQLREPGVNREGGQVRECTPCDGPSARTLDPTTSFLTAAALIYATGAGITAAAGTRLALQ